MWLLATCFINAIASKTPFIIQQALEELRCVATQLTDTRDVRKEIERPDAEEVKDGEIVRRGERKGKCRSARKTTVDCFYMVAHHSVPVADYLAHFNVSLAKAEHCPYHA